MHISLKNSHCTALLNGMEWLDVNVSFVSVVTLDYATTYGKIIRMYCDVIIVECLIKSSLTRANMITTSPLHCYIITRWHRCDVMIGHWHIITCWYHCDVIYRLEAGVFWIHAVMLLSHIGEYACECAYEWDYLTFSQNSLHSPNICKHW